MFVCFVQKFHLVSYLMISVLMTGGNQPMPKALGTVEEERAARFESQVDADVD